MKNTMKKALFLLLALLLFAAVSLTASATEIVDFDCFGEQFYSDNYIYAEGDCEGGEHDWSRVHLAPNCTQPERYLYTCNACGREKVEIVPGGDPYFGHNVQLFSAPATCLDAPVEVYKCTRCDYEDVIEVDPILCVDDDKDKICDLCKLSISIASSGICGDNLTWTLDEDGTLVISGTGDMYGYGLYSPWYDNRVNRDNRNYVKKVIVEPGVTSIGNYAFAACSALTEITIPDSVTSIGVYAFRGCTALTEITIPDSVTSIGDSVFSDCTALTKITIPNSVTSIGEAAFNNCTALTEITIPDSVTIVEGDAFYGCTSLTKINIPGSVISVGYYAFLYCSSLTEITISKGVKALDFCAFGGCTSLTTITIPKSVETLGQGAFCECTALEKIIILNPDCYFKVDEELEVNYGITDEITIPHDTVIYGYDNSTAQAYAEKYDRVFVSLGAAPTESAEIVTDSDSGVQIEYTDEAYPQEITLQIEEVSDGSMYLTQQYGKIKTWNISTLIDGVQVQPAVPVQLRLPLPADYNEDTVAVYHVNLQADVLEQIQPVTIENGYICFAATSFSPYILVDESSVITPPEPEDPTKPDVPDEPVEPDIPEDPADTCDHLCHKDGILGFFWKIIRFFWKLFGMNPVCECGAAHY